MPAQLDYRSRTPISKNWGYDRGLPIDRHYIYHFLKSFSGDIRGRVLEVQSPVYAHQFGKDRISHLDILDVSDKNPQATIVGDLASSASLPTNAFDCIICTQTLQFCYDCRAAARRLHDMLAPSGVLLATLPGITKIEFNDDYQWYWNFTRFSARRLFQEAFPHGRVAVHSYGNVLSGVSFLHGIAGHELASEELAERDPEYEVTIGVRAQREQAQRQERR